MEQINLLRKEIDKIDNQIIVLLGKRFFIVKKIGKIKKDLNINIVDKKREKEKLLQLKHRTKELNLPSILISFIWKKIFSHSYKIEKES